jgi:hypothetical protein
MQFTTSKCTVQEMLKEVITAAPWAFKKESKAHVRPVSGWVTTEGFFVLYFWLCVVRCITCVAVRAGQLNAKGR